jgi:hypothetical protein
MLREGRVKRPDNKKKTNSGGAGKEKSGESF